MTEAEAQRLKDLVYAWQLDFQALHNKLEALEEVTDLLVSLTNPLIEVDEMDLHRARVHAIKLLDRGNDDT